VARLKGLIEDFKEVLPLVEQLANPALQARHWRQVLDVLEAQVEENEDGTGPWAGCWPGDMSMAAAGGVWASHIQCRRAMP
jgi:hypothetical protein